MTGVCVCGMMPRQRRSSCVRWHKHAAFNTDFGLKIRERERSSEGALRWRQQMHGRACACTRMWPKVAAGVMVGSQPCMYMG